MKHDRFLWQLSGFTFAAVGGTLLHFLYDWSQQSLWVAPFSGVNESTWEHMKLLFFPLFVFALVQSRFFRDEKGFWCIKLKGTLAGLTAIPVLFYTYNGVFGPSPAWLNITIFYIAAAIAFWVEHHWQKKDPRSCAAPRLAMLFLWGIAVLFVVFTFYPPKIPLFLDPLTATDDLFPR